MEEEMFQELMESLRQAAAHARGELDLKTTYLLKPPPQPAELNKEEITEIRKSLHATQSVFAKCLNVSVKTVQGWEQGIRKPSQAALKLLRIAKEKPEVLLIG